jgi:hypothetical protein
MYLQQLEKYGGLYIFRYSGYIIRIPITFEEMFILRMILTNEIMEAHGCGNNHHLLLHCVTRHPVKYSPLLFQHTKRALYHVANTWMQMVEMLLLTIWSRPSPPIRHMIPLTLVWWQISRSIWVPDINHIIFSCTYMLKMKLMTMSHMHIGIDLRKNGDKWTDIPRGGVEICQHQVQGRERAH